MAKETKVKPTLQAFLLCEKVDTSPDGVQSLIRVFDRTTMNVDVVRPPGSTSPPPPGAIKAEYEFTIFTKWGNGVGHFHQWVEMINPKNEKVTVPETLFWLPSKAAGHNTIGRMRVGISEGGRYLIKLYLDGELIAEITWMVEFNVREIPQLA